MKSRSLPKVSQEERIKIIKDYKAGAGIVELMKKYGVANYAIRVLLESNKLRVVKKYSGPKRVNQGKCSKDGCKEPQDTKQLCQKHYNQEHAKKIGVRKRTPEQLLQEKLRKRALRKEEKLFNYSILDRYPSKDFTIIHTDAGKLESFGSPKLGLRANLQCLKKHGFIVDFQMTSPTQLIIVISKAMDIAVSLRGLTVPDGIGELR